MSKLDLTVLNTPNFRLRLLSALILAPAVLLTVYCGGWIFPLIVMAIVTLGLHEWLRLVDPEAPGPVIVFAFVTLLVVMGVGASLSVALGAMLGVFMVLVLFLVAVRYQAAKPERAAWVALGIPYMAGSGLAMIYLRQVPSVGMELVYYLLATVWATDIGAYLAGRLIGGPKMAPEISPSKTWAGLLGGMVAASISGYIVSLGFGSGNSLALGGLALILAVVSQLGDLFESYFKRRSGVKESGGLIPGHGGILDRIDGLVFASIFLMLFHMANGAHMSW